MLDVRVVVMNNRRPVPDAPSSELVGGYEAGEATHPVFAGARSEMCGDGGCTTRSLSAAGSSWEGGSVPAATHWVTGPASPEAAGLHFSFVVNGRPVPEDGTDEGSPNVPGYRVRQQTRDVAELLDAVFSLYGGTADYYMFAEDDFRLCPGGMQALAFLLARASHPLHSPTADWNAIRISFGLNGAIIRMADVPALALYFRQHVARRPPDHLTVEWFAGEKPQSAATKRGRPHVAFRYNLLEHFGFSSSLRASASPTYALCYDELVEGVVFEVEAYKPQQCGHDLLWPCLDKGRADVLAKQLPAPDPGLDFEALRASAKEDSVQTWKMPL